MELQVGVKAFLKNKDGKYLLVKRSERAYPGAGGKWDIVGGRVRPDEALLDALRREITEEVGLELRDIPILVGAQDIMKPDKHVVRITYTASIDGEVVLDVSEHTEYGWLTKDEIMGLALLDKYVKELIDNGNIQL